MLPHVFSRAVAMPPIVHRNNRRPTVIVALILPHDTELRLDCRKGATQQKRSAGYSQVAVFSSSFLEQRKIGRCYILLIATLHYSYFVLYLPENWDLGQLP